MDTNGHPVSAASGEPEVNVHGAQFRKVCGSWRFVSGAMLLMVSPETNHVLDALVEARAERDAAVRERDVWEREAVDGREVLAHHKRELDAAVHQIKIAKVCNDSQAELIERLTLEKMQRFDELNTLRARLAAALNRVEVVCGPGPLRYRLVDGALTVWVATGLALATENALTTTVEADCTTWTLSSNPEITPTPPQDAATTRGEG